MKSIVLIFLMSSVIIACDTSNPEPVTFELRPSRFEEEDFTREYYYNNANQLTQIKLISLLPKDGSLTSTQNFTYLSNGKMAETTSDTGFKFVYTYEGDKISRTDE
jgi:hypothetical protein